MSSPKTDVCFTISEQTGKLGRFFPPILPIGIADKRDNRQQ
ncbi:hypothetical protein [Yersinia pestis]|uniref:Uncharacterized protein n=3 Tax=Yersinia pseudotuberculosis complex TaxID=1649845 RepID=A0A0H3B3P1_YERPY|nr:hypothetical protein [Yersinia pestis]ADV99008.1 hypothetical protein YPC_2442 [Yersinia pestis biovar Medievalis str. Harbin 35]EDR32007.1 hypothetical protein YPIP275_2206 [Yersinia pestis biovar Orientalis str. IP275]EDR39293.1 hypothetical protein YpF1991016_3768 [Yersinia pestis biovar Orientalis str. F1991016]EDR42489.1 hypothetical protein YpE1979001_4353 [Yersinia pestis biovar Antiqua str. E1979001]EDR52260.1 hypothetical protein YpB42003004_1202 [Yersinia pestis biovar Antiqua str